MNELLVQMVLDLMLSKVLNLSFVDEKTWLRWENFTKDCWLIFLKEINHQQNW